MMKRMTGCLDFRKTPSLTFGSCVVGIGVYFFLMLSVANAQSDSLLDFNRDVRPILSDNCFLCHGPAESTREADLRLDDREAAIASEAIVPGDTEQGSLIERIESEDAEMLMPPPDSNKRLSEAEKEVLKRWIAEGAKYQQHWSFVPPVKSVEVSSNPVDFFIQRKLRETGLQPSSESELSTLIRRVSFDLVGLAPTPREVEAFVEDARSSEVDQAYERVVDRLLASPAYGERMTLAWLDAARYGDTSVMHADGPRDMWPWRDWVLKAYNTNMPFDQFTIEQLAGDLIPNATTSQKLASGFNRNHGTSDEGGAFPEELRVEYVVDRVQTTSTVWLGLTMECSQCHDHKYDPISQQEYYQFFAYFNNTTDPGMQTRNGNQKPVVEVVTKKRQEQLSEALARIDKVSKALQQHRDEAETEFAEWVKKESEAARGPDAASEELTGLIQWFPLDLQDGKQLKNNVTGEFATLEKGKFQTSDRGGNKALELDGRTQFVSSESSMELQGDAPFSLAAWIKSDGRSGGAVFSRMDVANGYRGYDLWIQGRNIGTHIIHSWPGNALKVVSKDQLKPNTWQHVVITYDGSQKAAGIKIYIDGKLSGNTVEADTLSETIETTVPFRIGSRSSNANWKGGVDDIRIYDRAVADHEVARARDNPVARILAMDAADRTSRQVQILREFYFATEDKTYQKFSRELAKAKTEHQALSSKPITSMIMEENLKSPRMTYVLDRGQYDSPLKEQPVNPGVPAALPPLADNAPANRLGLAQWLTQPDHPLTARVAVNRYWMMLFGQGLVRTAGDFGAQGAPPTHPELLDWLAVDFVESGWDVKRMLKLLVMSDTYRQSSVRTELYRQQDPENELLEYSPRFRLQGEMIRDHALAVSGLLVDQVGGPSVKPYQPPNIWNEVSLNGGLRYKRDSGEKLYRKSMYTYWKRSAPMPSMMIFDSPSREKCTVQRARTNTPLQALVTLNDPQFVEAARVLAEDLLLSKPDDRSRIHEAYQRCISRPATDRELAIIESLLSDQRTRFRQAPEKAMELLKVGEARRDESLDASEHAAWTVIAQMIFNLDETLTRN